MNEKILQTDITGIGDPFILAHEDKYYMYATSHKNGFKVFVSADLKEWSDAGLCYYDSKWAIHDNNFWAPEVYLYKGRFYMFFTARWTKNNSLRIAVAVADSPLGRFEDIPGMPFDFGYAMIDGNVFFDDDGKNYFYYTRDVAENIIDGKRTSQIYAVELTEDLTKVLGEPKMILTPDTEWELVAEKERWNEGPALIKHDNTYFMFYSANMFASKFYSVCYAAAKSPMGPFTKASENPVLKYIEGRISGPGHNSFFKTFDGQLMTAYHIHTHYDAPGGDRRACMSKVFFKDGKPVIDYK